MIRSMTSNVSALSGIVANGHQTLHFVSSAPSKIPYGGFSPVRLQTRLTPRPPSPAFRRLLIGRHCRYLVSRRFVRSRSCDQAAPSTSDHDRESSGPWLPSRLCCPASSSLTMATCAPLSAARRLMDYSAELRDQPASRRGSPIYSANPFTPCRRPYSGGASDWVRRILPRWYCLRHFRTGSATTSPTIPDHVGRVTKLQRSLHAAAWRCCSPGSGPGFYDRAFMGRVTPEAHVDYDWMAIRHLPWPDFHRLDWQPYGLRAKYAKHTNAMSSTADGTEDADVGHKRTQSITKNETADEHRWARMPDSAFQFSAFQDFTCEAFQLFGDCPLATEN